MVDTDAKNSNRRSTANKGSLDVVSGDPSHTVRWSGRQGTRVTGGTDAPPLVARRVLYSATITA